MPDVRSDESSRGLLRRRTRQSATVIGYHGVDEPAGRLNEPIRLRSENSRETTRAAKEIACDAHIAGFRIISGFAARRVHGCNVDSDHVGGHLRRTCGMCSRTRRERGEQSDEYQAAISVMTVRLDLPLTER